MPCVLSVCPVVLVLAPDNPGGFLVRVLEDLDNSATNFAFVSVRMVIVAVASARDFVKVMIVAACASMVSDLATAACASKANDVLMPFAICRGHSPLHLS